MARLTQPTGAGWNGLPEVPGLVQALRCEAGVALEVNVERIWMKWCIRTG